MVVCVVGIVISLVEVSWDVCEHRNVCSGHRLIVIALLGPRGDSSAVDVQGFAADAGRQIPGP